MTIPGARSSLLVLVGAVVGSGIAGVSSAATSTPTLKACSDSKGALVLQSKGRCPKRTTSVKLGLSGPTGPVGAPGSPGAPGATGAPGKDGTNGTNGTNGTDGAQGPGATSAVLDNQTTQREDSGLHALTGTDFYFGVSCAANGSATLRLLSTRPEPFSLRGTAFLDTAGDTSSTIAVGSATGATTPGTSLVDYEVPAGATAFNGPLLTVVDRSGGTVNVSADLTFQEPPVPIYGGPLNTISFVATIKANDCNSAAAAVPSS